MLTKAQIKSAINQKFLIKSISIDYDIKSS